MDDFIKRRALFLRSIAITLNINLVVDDNFCELLNSFLENYYLEYRNLFDLVYINEEVLDEDREELFYKQMKYLHDFMDNDKAIKLYNDIGFENVDNISELAYLFCEYYYNILNIKKEKALIKC